MFVHVSHPDVGEAVVSEAAARHLALLGWVIESIADGPGASSPSSRREMKRPQKNDSTAAWRTYAVGLGVENGGLTVAEAFALSRDELVEKYAPTPAGKATSNQES